MVCLLLWFYVNVLVSVDSQGKDTISLLKQYPNSFITRNGSTLQIEGNTIRMAGPNIYWLGLDENGSPGIDYPSSFRVEDAIATATKVLGATVIRAHTLGISQGQTKSFESSLNTFTQSGIEHIDYAIHIARKYNVRLVIPFTDNYNYYHGGEITFCKWRGTTDTSQFYSNPTIISDFKNYINHLLNHVNNYTGLALKDDPTIMAWETGNELGKKGTTPMPTQWTNDICQYIKSITQKQLVLDGRYGINSEELNYECVDIYSDHFYPMNAKQLLSDAKQVYNANKVYFAGEYGWDQGSPEPFVETIENSTTNMDCYWSLFPHNDSYGFEYHNDGFSVYYPGNNVNISLSQTYLQSIIQLRAHAYKMAGFDQNNLPNYPICGTPKISYLTCGSQPNHNITNQCRQERFLYWRGGYGCVNYAIERNDYSNNQNDKNWISKVVGVSDFIGYWYDNQSINSNAKCVYYRIKGMNYDKKYGNNSDVFNVCYS
eukprot:277345_1